MITPLITTPYISRVLGAELIGRNSYATAVSSYFAMFAAMGVAIYGQREISYLQDDKEKRSLKFWNIKVLSCVSVFNILIVYLLYVLFLSHDKKLSIIFCVAIVTVAVDVTWFFQGMEQFEKIATRNIVIKLLHLAFTFFLINNKSDFYLYVIGNVGFSFVSAALLWIYIPKHVQKISLSELHPYKELFPVWSLFIPTIAISIYTLLDKTMIGWFSNSSVQNGYYEQSLTIIRFLQSFVTSLGIVMIPRIGSCFEKKDYYAIRNYMYRSYNFVWLLGIPLCLGIISTAPNFIPWFLGIEFLDAVPLVRVLSLLLLAIGINNVTGNQYLIPTKKHKLYTKSVIIGAVVNFLLNLCLIPHFKALGAAFASVVAEFVIAIVQIYWIKQELNPKEIVKSIWKYAIAGIIMMVVVSTIEGQVDASIGYSLLLATIGVIVYIVILGLLKEQLLFGYVRRYMERLKGKLVK